MLCLAFILSMLKMGSRGALKRQLNTSQPGLASLGCLAEPQDDGKNKSKSVKLF